MTCYQMHCVNDITISNFSISLHQVCLCVYVIVFLFVCVCALILMNELAVDDSWERGSMRMCCLSVSVFLSTLNMYLYVSKCNLHLEHIYIASAHIKFLHYCVSRIIFSLNLLPLPCVLLFVGWPHTVKDDKNQKASDIRVRAEVNVALQSPDCGWKLHIQLVYCDLPM